MNFKSKSLKLANLSQSPKLPTDHGHGHLGGDPKNTISPPILIFLDYYLKTCKKFK